MKQKILCVFNTNVGSRNVGDEIIMDSVNKITKETFPNYSRFDVATHQPLSKELYKLINRSDIKIVAGTNLLSSNMPFYNQWKINIFDSFFLNDVILLGVGWWQYQVKPNIYTKTLLKRILSKKHIHSVRDEYTRDMLSSIGIKNVVNTTCPTMWDLTPKHCRKIPMTKTLKVVFTLTSYKKDDASDREFINALIKNYKEIFFWPQQPDDINYFERLKIKSDSVKILPLELLSLDTLLRQNRIDYLGTRLHAGIRSLLHGMRTLILEVDNRSSEIAKDTNLPTVKRNDITSIEKWIYGETSTRIVLPEKCIKKWKDQFR
jgi:polysaccharide pyruvyl transferase WcaK-like protein